MAVTNLHKNIDHWADRVDLAAAFRWTARLNMHEAVANHFSFAINAEGTRFLMNPNQTHFARIKASNLIVVDANDPETLTGPNAPDATAWGLHGGLHRHCPHARCAIMCIRSLPLCWPRWPTAVCCRSTRIAPPSLTAR